MRKAGAFRTKALVALLTLLPALLPGPATASADLVGTAPVVPAEAPRVPAGYAGDEISGRLARLDPDEQTYFAARPERVQVVAGISWAEMAGGLILLGGVIAAVIARLSYGHSHKGH